MPNNVYDEQGMQAAHATMSATADGIRQEGTQMQGAVSAFLATWQGNASVAFSSAMEDWYTVNGRLTQEMSAIGASMNSHAGMVGQTNDSTNQAATQLQIQPLPNF